MATIKLEEIRANPVKTSDATLAIEMSEDRLAIGGHTFQLQVADDSGNVSAPAEVVVIVVDTGAPTAVVRVLDAEGRPAVSNRIAHGANFILDGRSSIDVGGGSIVSYSWTLVE